MRQTRRHESHRDRAGNPQCSGNSAHVHARFDSDGARRSRRRASCVLRGHPCPVTYHQKIRASRHLQRASMELRTTSANLGSQRRSVESCLWLRPTRRQEFRGRLRADGSKSCSPLNSARLNSATSQFKNIRRLHKAAPTIERFASRSRPENHRVGPRARHHDSALFNKLLPSPWLRISGTT
jgi:hypothetical protein